MAILLSELFERNMVKIFESLSLRCIREDMSSAASHKSMENWVALRKFLERYSSSENLYAERSLETILSYDNQFNVPLWLFDLFKVC